MLVRLTGEIDSFKRWHPRVMCLDWDSTLREGAILTMKDRKTRRMIRGERSTKVIRLFHRGQEVFVLASEFAGRYKEVPTHKR